MAHKATTWAWETKVGSGAAKIVLLNLADHADHSFQCFPSLDRICAQTELSKSTVIRSLKFLIAEGLISRDRRTRPDGTRQSNLYLLHVVSNQVSQRHLDQVSNHPLPGVTGDTYRTVTIEPKNKSVSEGKGLGARPSPMVEIAQDDGRVRALRQAKVKMIPTTRFTFMVPPEALSKIA